MDKTKRGASKTPFLGPAISLATEVPGSTIAAMGIALAIYMYELGRMSSFQTVSGSDFLSVASGIVVALGAAALGLAYLRKPRLRLHRHTGLVLSVAGIFMVSVLLTLNASLITVGDTLGMALRLASRALAVLLLVLWVEPVLRLSARNAAVLLSLSIVIFGFINLATCFLRESSSALAVAMFPVFSMICLSWFKDRLEVFYGGSEGRSASEYAFHTDRSLMPIEPEANRINPILYFLQPLFLCPIAFGFIHFSWIPVQDGASGSMLIQVSAALGTTLGGVLLYTLVTRFWGRRKLALYNLFMLLVIMFAMSLINAPAATAPFPYVVLLNVAQKITFFFMLMTPFLVASKFPPLSVWCGGLILYQLGKTVSVALSLWGNIGVYHAITSVCIFASAVCILIGMVSDQGKRAYEKPDDPSEPASQPQVQPEVRTETQAFPSVSSIEMTCRQIARDLMLTRREEDVLILAANKKAAHEIAEELVIGDSTAKTHLRNLYNKLDVHSKNELIAYVENYGAVIR